MRILALDLAELQHLYVRHRLSENQIALAYSMSRRTVGKILRRSGIEMRGYGKCATEIERFNFKFKRGPGCWEWNSTFDGDGYGKFKTSDGRTVRPHRYAWEKSIGPIPAGMQIDHLCRNRACVNPAHMEVVTGIENNRRGFSITAVNERKTHCVHGHEFSEKNTYRPGKRPGSRYCVECRRINAAERYKRLVARCGS